MGRGEQTPAVDTPRVGLRRREMAPIAVARRQRSGDRRRLQPGGFTCLESSHCLLRSCEWIHLAFNNPARLSIYSGQLVDGPLAGCSEALIAEYKFDGRAAETDLFNSVRSALRRGADARVIELPRFVFDMNGKFVDHFPVLHQDTVSLEFQLVFATFQLAVADGGGAGQRDAICLGAGDRSAEQRECE